MEAEMTMSNLRLNRAGKIPSKDEFTQRASTPILRAMASPSSMSKPMRSEPTLLSKGG
ncbi:hypothetical protein D3C78_1961550 [compost metagenome]